MNLEIYMYMLEVLFKCQFVMFDFVVFVMDEQIYVFVLFQCLVDFNVYLNILCRNLFFVKLIIYIENKMIKLMKILKKLLVDIVCCLIFNGIKYIINIFLEFRILRKYLGFGENKFQVGRFFCGYFVFVKMNLYRFQFVKLILYFLYVKQNKLNKINYLNYLILKYDVKRLFKIFYQKCV